MDTPRSITHFETDSFFFALDQLIREQVPVVITVPVKPPSGSGLYKRLQFCQSLIDAKDPSYSSKLGSARFFAKLSKFVFHKASKSSKLPRLLRESSFRIRATRNSPNTNNFFARCLTPRSTRTQPAPAVSSSNFPGFFAPAKILSPAGPVNFFR